MEHHFKDIAERNRQAAAEGKAARGDDRAGPPTVAALVAIGADYPTGGGEKIICLKNRYDLGLINGMFLTLTEVRQNPDDAFAFSAMVETEDGTSIAGRRSFWHGEYADHVAFDPERGRREWQVRRGLIESSWGYAITGHKAQGSQYPTVVVFDDGYGRTAEDRNRWLYTAITRAEWGLVILS